MKNKKQAWINWSKEEHRWVLRLWIDEQWGFSKSWGVRAIGENAVTGEPFEWVCDDIVCEIANLQDLGYEVRVTV